MSRARFGIKVVALGVQAVPALVRACPSGSLVRTVIGVLTLAARPLVATPVCKSERPAAVSPSATMGTS